MQRRAARIFVAAILAAAPVTSQEKKPLAFEVASIKPSQGNQPVGGIRAMPGGRRYVATNATLRLMIQLMYKVTNNQIVGGPSWINTEPWDVNAEAERPMTLDQLHEMYKTMLADRFGLKFHHETREMAALVFTVDKSGVKMKRNDSPEPFDFPIKPDGEGKMVGTHVNMEYFCWFVAQRLNLPVADQTGLDGFYDFTLQLPPPDPDRVRENGGPDVGDLFAAIREQLGVRVESRKAPVPVMVIDEVKRAGEN